VAFMPGTIAIGDDFIQVGVMIGYLVTHGNL